VKPHDNPDTNPELSFNFIPVDTIVSNFYDFTPELLSFVQCNMRQQITSAASSLHDAHARCLQTLILYAHDLTRDVVVTPKRIKYARTKEEELYSQLIDLSSKKQSEIKELVHQAIADATDDIVKQVTVWMWSGWVGNFWRGIGCGLLVPSMTPCKVRWEGLGVGLGVSVGKGFLMC